MKASIIAVLICSLISVNSFASGPVNLGEAFNTPHSDLYTGCLLVKTKGEIVTAYSLSKAGMKQGNRPFTISTRTYMGNSLNRHYNTNSLHRYAQNSKALEVVNSGNNPSKPFPVLKRILDIQEFKSIDPGVAMLARVSKKCWLGLNGTCRSATPLKLLRNPAELMKEISAGISLKVGISR